ncbi:class I SAM-dependent methyltransferase [Virgisporangium aurantiacum]|uniref:Methyltransferase n=1 Tax=Virgisporangium aurantiacum TaxID=175570 RepID=A0A8J3Z1I3_9ACTN|nr:class I SAM-dependent methyltransferase [Virgisporangium aurantiacum]GIJ53625.1 methyltransferase [Virgisporangium aurantiacum]
MTDFASFERAGWAEKAAGYDRLLGRVTAHVTNDVLDAAGVSAGSRLLDVGCGGGAACGAAAERGAIPVGVDLAPAMVELARERYPELDFLVGSASDLPVTGPFDAVIGNFLVHHLAEPEAAVGRFAEVLAPGGRLALTSWDEPHRNRLVGVLAEAIAAVGARPPAGLPPGPPFFRFADHDEFAALLGGAGFTGVSVVTIAFPHRIAGPDELWNTLISGTVRTAAVVEGQPDDVRAAIRAEFDRLVAEHGSSVPVSVTLAAGRS